MTIEFECTESSTHYSEKCEQLAEQVPDVELSGPSGRLRPLLKYSLARVKIVLPALVSHGKNL